MSLAGDGPELENLKLLANELGMADKVKFLGLLSEYELPNFLNGLDIYCHFSKFETQSTAILQAMSCGKPIFLNRFESVEQYEEIGFDGEVSSTNDLQTVSSELLNYIESKPGSSLKKQRNNSKPV